MKNFTKAVSITLMTATSLAFSISAHAEDKAKPTSSIDPKFSLVFDARYASYDNDPEEYELPGFSLGGEAELPEDGLSLGHIELGASADLSKNLTSKLNVAIARHDGEFEIELEEAYLESIGLGNGLSVRAGRFFPNIGRVNSQHNHAWEFVDAPLVYNGLWGAKYIDDGVRLNWIAPTDTFLEFGVEALKGSGFPAGGEVSVSGIASKVAYANIGGDINASSSWQAGLSFHDAEVADRESGGHGHGHEEEGEGEEEGEEVPAFSGDSKTTGLNVVYKWSPNGNPKSKHFIFQAEYFKRDESGEVVLEGSNPLESALVDLEQKGFYLQGIYKFAPHWRAGLRYDRLTSNNRASDDEVLEESGLDNEGIKPTRYSIMTEWVPSEVTRVRLQLTRDESSENEENQVFLQFTRSFGAHAAHSF